MNRKLDTIFSKDKKIHCILLFVVAVCFLSITTAYSALYTTMDISGTAYARVEADVRITDFRLASINNATSSFEEFGKSHTVTEVDLIDSTSSITYYLEITNYGSVDIGIFDITGLPEGVNYSIKDYNLHDKICDDSGKCNSFVTKTYEITLTTTSTYSGNVQLNFDFRTYHQVVYSDITNNGYPVDVIDGGDLVITFKDNINRLWVLSDGVELGFYSKVNSGEIITISNIVGDVEVKIKDWFARLVSGSIDEVGSEVCIGKECFYIISNDGETVTMLSKYNLYVGGELSPSNAYVLYGDEATGIQDPSMIGWYAADQPRRGVIAFTGYDSYWSKTVTSYPANVYASGSNLYPYVQNYKKYLDPSDSLIKNIRLITYEELDVLGCKLGNSYCDDDTPEFVYSTTYWTSTAASSLDVHRVTVSKGYGTNVGYGWSGLRPVIELDIDLIRPLISTVVGNGINVGDQVCISDECFYTISSDDDSITLFAKYNLLVGNKYDDTNKSKLIENPTGKQDVIAKGAFAGYSVSNPIMGVYPFSADYYWSSVTSSYPAFVYDENSYLYGFVTDYKVYLESLGIDIFESRIIGLDELESLGCSAVNYSCSDAPSWVYATTYWSGTARTSKHLWRIRFDGSLSYSDYASYSYGVRPVIVISKDIFN